MSHKITPNNLTKKIYIIAGEQSGDNIGAGVMQSLKKQFSGQIIFRGIGGAKMEEAGLNSLFPMQEISLMGFFEILPHIFKLIRLMQQAINDIIDFKPDLVITIDSPGFALKVVKSVKKSITTKFAHIVAPSVWAYKPERAKKFAQIYDLLLTLLPFEPPYFTKKGLKAEFIGHPVFSQEFCQDKSLFRKIYGIPESKKLICITPGSRKGEISRHLPIFIQALNLLAQRGEALHAIILLANDNLKKIIYDYLNNHDLSFTYTVTQEERFAAYKASDIALAKSGTNTLEIAAHQTPMIVGYKLNMLTWWVIKRMIKIKFASLINIFAGRALIPEYLQNDCTAKNIAQNLYLLLNDQDKRQEQVQEVTKIITEMGYNSLKSPSDNAAQHLIELL